MDHLIHGVCLTPLTIIRDEKGSVFHILRKDAVPFTGFGEVYISTIKPGWRKGWKRHRDMVLNITVPVGKIKFVLYDDRTQSPTCKKKNEITLSPENYFLLTVPPGIWMAFECAGPQESYLVNVASIPHEPGEADSLPLINNIIPHDWT